MGQPVPDLSTIVVVPEKEDENLQKLFLEAKSIKKVKMAPVLLTPKKTDDPLPAEETKT